MSTFKIRYEFRNARYTITDDELNLDNSVNDLLSQIYAKTFNGQTKNLMISFAGTELAERERKLSQYGFRNARNRIVVAIANDGGTQVSNKFKFGSDVKTKKTTCVFYNMKYASAELECGCYMSNEGICRFIESSNDSNILLKCPNKKCNKVLNDIDKIFYLANYADEDLEDILYDETKERYRKHNKEENNGSLSKCPNCKTMNKRPKSMKEYRIECGECELDYCFECEGKWKKSGYVLCGNKDCELWEIQEDLLECPPLPYKDRNDWVKTYNNKYGKTEETKIPSLRACPGCWRLLCVMNACQHINCAACHYNFCYICLKKWDNHNNTKCLNSGPYPRQRLS